MSSRKLTSHRLGHWGKIGRIGDQKKHPHSLAGQTARSVVPASAVLLCCRFPCQLSLCCVSLPSYPSAMASPSASSPISMLGLFRFILLTPSTGGVPHSLRGVPNGFNAQQQQPPQQARSVSSRLPNGKMGGGANNNSSAASGWAFGSGVPLAGSGAGGAGLGGGAGGAGAGNGLQQGQGRSQQQMGGNISFAQSLGGSQPATPLDLSYVLVVFVELHDFFAFISALLLFCASFYIPPFTLCSLPSHLLSLRRHRSTSFTTSIKSRHFTTPTTLVTLSFILELHELFFTVISSSFFPSHICAAFFALFYPHPFSPMPHFVSPPASKMHILEPETFSGPVRLQRPCRSPARRVANSSTLKSMAYAAALKGYI